MAAGLVAHIGQHFDGFSGSIKEFKSLFNALSCIRVENERGYIISPFFQVFVKERSEVTHLGTSIQSPRPCSSGNIQLKCGSSFLLSGQSCRTAHMIIRDSDDHYAQQLLSQHLNSSVVCGGRH